MTHQRRFTIPALLVALVVVTWVTVPAGPPIDRTFVAAVADDASDRVLVRWRIVDGPTRYSHFHVLRREATASDFEQLNDDPVGALETVAAIQAEFTAPGRGDALQQIQDDLGPDYAEQILDADPFGRLAAAVDLEDLHLVLLVVHLAPDDVLGQAELGDAIDEYATGRVESLEDRCRNAHANDSES